MIAVILGSSNIKNNQKQRIIMENNIKKDSVETPNEDKSANASQKSNNGNDKSSKSKETGCLYQILTFLAIIAISTCIKVCVRSIM